MRLNKAIGVILLLLGLVFIILDLMQNWNVFQQNPLSYGILFIVIGGCYVWIGYYLYHS